MMKHIHEAEYGTEQRCFVSVIFLLLFFRFILHIPSRAM